MVIHVVTYKIFVELDYWNYLVIFTAFGSLLFYYFSIFLLNIPAISERFQKELTLKIFSMFSTTSMWIYVFSLPLICLLVDLSIKFLFKFYCPSPVEIIRLNKISENKEDVNIVKRLSTILDPKDLYMYRKKGQTPRSKKADSIIFCEENGNTSEQKIFGSNLEMKEIK